MGKTCVVLITLVLLAAGCLFLIPLETAGSSKPSSESSALDSDSADVLLNVPYRSQENTLPTGCELVSAMMVLDYYGVSVTPEQMVAHTPVQRLAAGEDGALSGPHPDRAFVGDPRTPYGYGCYPPVLKTALESLLDSRYQVQDRTGSSLSKLAKDYLDQSVPVLIWATIDMQPSSSGSVWTVEETGQTFTWTRPEHCLVLTGYSETQYYFNDPYRSNGRVSYPRALVEQRFQELGKRALAVIRAK